MKKRSANLPVIAVAAVAVCLVAVAATLIIKARVVMPPAEETTGNYQSVGNNYYYPTTEESTTGQTTSSIFDLTTQVITDTYVPTTQKATQKPTQAQTTKPAPTEPKTEPATEEVTVPQVQAGANSGVAVTPSGNLPQDMSFAGLSLMGYDVIGQKPYIYNDDKDPECFQANLGYTPLYDWGAGLIDFSIETTRLDFNYDNKQYRIQLWKGQYISGSIGTVGGEIGVYTRPKGSVGQFYNCAEQDDWLKMEMTVYWDEFDNGEYLPQFTRNYNDFWWATGFVDGQLKNRNDSNTLRVLGRITFESEEQAVAFDEAMAKKGFTKVEDFSPYEIDTYKRYGKDVIFIWQNIR
ncbi:MAG: DUF4474 domain-containing protein [Clostridia bacterium]|nr:DUF4474 domain-containing protein [Clostridia bacterium]